MNHKPYTLTPNPKLYTPNPELYTPNSGRSPSPWHSLPRDLDLTRPPPSNEILGFRV